MKAHDSTLPTVTVIISHLNSARTIFRCLTHLDAVDYPKEKLEVIVVDGGSIDGSIDIVERFGQANLRQIVVPGCPEAEGQTLGVTESKGDVIMFTNSDIYVPVDWVKRHIRWLREGYDIAGGAVFWGGDKYTITWNQPLPTSPYFHVEPGLGLGFSNCSMRKDFLLRIGGLKNLSSQHDAEFALRSVARGGHLVLDPLTEVYHDHPFRSFFQNFKRSYGYAVNHITVVRAMFGRIVAGSGMPIFMSPSTLFGEVTGMRSLRTYEDILKRVKKWNVPITVGPAEFVFIRVFSTKFGQLAGVLAGAIPPRVNLSNVRELHTSVKPPQKMQDEISRVMTV